MIIRNAQRGEVSHSGVVNVIPGGGETIVYTIGVAYNPNVKVSSIDIGSKVQIEDEPKILNGVIEYLKARIEEVESTLLERRSPGERLYDQLFMDNPAEYLGGAYSGSGDAAPESDIKFPFPRSEDR